MSSKTAAALAGAALLFAGAAVAKSADHEFKGVVNKLDPTAKTLVVKAESGKTEMHFAVAPDAKIMHGAKAKSLGDLTVGEKVKVTYTDQASTHRAQRIEILGTTTAKARPSPSKSASPSAAKPGPSE